MNDDELQELAREEESALCHNCNGCGKVAGNSIAWVATCDECGGSGFCD